LALLAVPGAEIGFIEVVPAIEVTGLRNAMHGQDAEDLVPDRVVMFFSLGPENVSSEG
jgi:hypothetical protein